LFLWNSRPDSEGLPLIAAHNGVSILVFVELAPGQRKHPRKPKASLVSILVFVELAPGRFKSCF